MEGMKKAIMKRDLKQLLKSHQNLLKQKEALNKKLDRSRILLENSLTKIYKGKLISIKSSPTVSFMGQIEEVGIDTTDQDCASIRIRNKGEGTLRNIEIMLSDLLFDFKTRSIEILKK